MSFSSLFSWYISPRGVSTYLSIPHFWGIVSINLLNIFSSPCFSLVKRSWFLVAGRPVVLSQSFILAALSWVSMWLEYHEHSLLCSDISLSFSSPKLDKQLLPQQSASGSVLELIYKYRCYHIKINSWVIINNVI